MAITSGANYGRGHDLQLRAGLGDHLGGLQRGVVTGVIKQQHLAKRLGVATENVPGRTRPAHCPTAIRRYAASRRWR